ncbi:MAG: F0F1 ATP synthase subunit gamma [Anaerolineaceae bacterium]|nr:F0F1 ATP synthase subunit gamma [Anaerolineaceae bacterium]
MSETSEGTENRLENLQAIKPLITALRTKSLSTLQSALNRKNLLHDYQYDYQKILSTLILLRKKQNRYPHRSDTGESGIPYLIILGSERGICGSFDKTLVNSAVGWASKQKTKYCILTYGKRLSPDLNNRDIEFKPQGSLSVGALPKYRIAHNLVKGWLKDFDHSILISLEILSFRKSKGDAYKPKLTSLLPFLHDSGNHNDYDIDWPPPIIDGDPEHIIERSFEHLTAISFYEIILESIAAENYFRYNLLEEAKKNIDELVDLLTTITQIAKRAAITQQIQELSVGAGLTND